MFRCSRFVRHRIPLVTEPHSGSTRTTEEFAGALTALRLQSGLTVRAVAKATGLPVSTLGGYFSGRHLPPATRPDVLESVLDALSVPTAQRPGWHEALRRLTRRGAAAGSPFPGLRSFEVGDRANFHGREALIDRLTRLVTGSAGVIVAVVGASGAGKSSLLNAGLVPALDGWSVVVCQPDGALDALSGPSLSGDRQCLVVDSFQDVWVSMDESDRRAVLDALETWVHAKVPVARVVVIGLRADFYAAAAEEQVLLPALRDRSLLVGPMTTEELRSAIVAPAVGAGREPEPELVDLLIAESAARTGSGAAPTLPHLSHCLAIMWDAAAHRDRLTTADYWRTGGIAGAVSKTAEAAFGQLSEAQRADAERLFLRLVVVEQDLPRAAAVVSPDALEDIDWAVVEHFASHRIITLDEHTVQLSHEAVIDAWPRLQEWLDASTMMLLQRRLVAREAAAWTGADRDPDLLLRGARLADAESLTSDSSPVRLTAAEREFVAAGTALEAATARRARSRRRQQRWFVAGLAALLVVAVIAAIGYVRVAGQATAERDVAQSRELAVTARSLAVSDPSVAAQLAVAAYRTRDTLQARSALIDATADPGVTRLVGTPGDRMVTAAPGAHLLVVTGAMPTTDLYDTRGSSPRKVGSVATPLASAPGSAVFGAALSPDGRLLVLGGDAGAIRLYDVTDPTRARRLGGDTPAAGTVFALAFRDGILYAATDKGGVQRWQVSPATGIGRALPGLATGGTTRALSVSASGAVAAGTDTGKIMIWQTPAGSRPSRVIDDGPLPVSAVDLAGDGTLLAGSHDGTLKRWHLSGAGTPQPDLVARFNSWVNTVGHLGDALVAGSSDTTMRLWRGPTDDTGVGLGAPGIVATLAPIDGSRFAIGLTNGEVEIIDATRLLAWPGQGGIFTTAFARQGRLLLTASSAIDTWSLYDTTDPTGPRRIGPPVPGGQPDSILDGAATISPDGRLVVAGHRNGSLDGYAVPADAAAGASVTHAFRITASTALPESLAISHDGHTLAVGADEHPVRLYDLTTNPPAPRGVLDQPKGNILSVAFSPDDHLLAAASLDGNTYLWRRTTPGAAWTLAATLHGTGYAEATGFAPDGKTLATAGATGAVSVWAIDDPTKPALATTLTGPTGDVLSLAFSTTGELAAASVDKTVTIWHPGLAGRAYTEVAQLTGLQQSGFSIAWSPDGHTLAAGGAAGALRTWRTNPADAITILCATTGTPLTTAESHHYAPDVPTQTACG